MSTLYEGYEFIEEDGGISSYRMTGNGLHILLAPQGAAPVSTFMITYRVGSRNEKPGETGATHFLEHMMFKGTERFSKKAGETVFNVLQGRGAQVNATTWNDRTNYYELLPSEHLHLAIDIESDRMRGLLLDPEEVKSERTVILNEFDRGENEPLRKLYHSVWSTAFEAHPYHHPTIGWRSDIEQITPQGLRSFYDRYYWPNHATVSVIGGFDPQAVMSKLMECFGGIERGPEPQNISIREPEQIGERRTSIRMTGGMPAIILAFKSPPAAHADTFALHLAGMILSSGKTSRLYRSLVDSGLASSQSAGASSFRDEGLFTVFAMLTQKSTIQEVESTINTELEKLAMYPATDEEIQRALSKLEAQTLYARDGSFSLASQLNEAIAAGDWKLHTQFLTRARSVTSEDIQSAARRYFTRDTRTVGVFEPKEIAIS